MLACGAMLALGACTDTKRVEVEKRVEVGDPAALEELNDLRRSLAAAQAALGASTPADQQAAVERAKKDLEAAQTALKARPEGSPGKSEAAEALTALGLALTAVDDLVGASASGASGPVALASMHTTLARAQTAIDAAQVKLKAAVAVAPATDTALRGLLAQAQAALTTAQVSLVPRLRSELEQAEDALEQAEDALEQAEKDAAAQAAERRGDTTLGEQFAPERFARNILPARSTGGVTWTSRTVLEVADGATTMVGDPNPKKLDIEQDAVPYARGKTLISANAIGTDELKLRGLTVRAELGNGPDETGDLEFHGGIEGGSAADLGVTTGDTAWQRTDHKVLSSIQLNEDGSGFTMKMGGPGTIFYDMERLTAIGPGTFSNQPGNGACASADAVPCDDHTTSDITAAFDNPAKDPDGDAAYHFSMVVPVNSETPHADPRSVNVDGPSLLEPWTNAGTVSTAAAQWVAYADGRGRRAYMVKPDYTGVVDLGDDDAVGGTGDDADTSGYANLAGEEYTDPADGSKYKVAWLRSTLPAPDGATLLESRRASRIDAGLPLDQLGVYTVKLSNYAGVDSKGTADESDDTHRYLRYAAYGLFNFLDYSAGTWPQFSRMQAFHFGYDAFSDADGNRPRDFSDDAVMAKFNGKTTGWILRNPEGRHISQLVRLRGDVTLEATLGGGTSDGTIEGSMKNFEYLRNGAWIEFPHAVLSHHSQATMNGVNLESADIGENGSYAGVAKVMASANKRFGEGRYGGSLYGPQRLGELETAGYWMLPRHIGDPSSLESCPTGRAGTSCITFGSIIGSFGAVSEPATE